jgi:hypothetical protein
MTRKQICHESYASGIGVIFFQGFWLGELVWQNYRPVGVSATTLATRGNVASGRVPAALDSRKPGFLKVDVIMIVVRILPVLLSFLLLAAHFSRAEHLALVLLSLMYPLVLLARRPWAVYAVQLALVLGGLEWVRRTVALVGERQQAGEAWARLAMILGAVAAFTFASVLVFRSVPIQRHYGLSADRTDRPR